MIILSVDYDEFQPETYRGCVLTIEDDLFDPHPHKIVFNTGDFWIDMNRANEIAQLASVDGSYLCSSSVDSFISDIGDDAECV